MKIEEVEPGVKYASQHRLTQGEMKILLILMEKPSTTQQIAEKLNTTGTLVNRQLMRLRLKDLVVIKDRDERGSNLFEVIEK